MQSAAEKETNHIRPLFSVLVGMIIIVLTSPFNIFSEIPQVATDSIAVDSVSVTEKLPTRFNRPVKPARRHTSPIAETPEQSAFAAAAADTDSLTIATDSVYSEVYAIGKNPTDSLSMRREETKFTFVPDPTKAVWMSALFPGLGQLYNRRYWKLPIVIGAYMGLGYATNWNNTMLRDYTRAYSDIMDNDPNTKSYMDFFAPTVKESNLDKSWLTDLLRRRKNYYRRNRDLCIICMVGVYAIAMIDAYVDAQLAHFDITPDLSVDIAPTLLPSNSSNRFSTPSVGLYWALNF